MSFLGFQFLRGILCFVVVLHVSDTRLIQGSDISLVDALQFLREYDKEASDVCFRVTNAQWNYATNMTDFNKRRMIEEQTHKARFDRLSWKQAIMFAWPSLPDPMARRQLKLLITKGRLSLSDEKYNEVRRNECNKIKWVIGGEEKLPCPKLIPSKDTGTRKFSTVEYTVEKAGEKYYAFISSFIYTLETGSKLTWEKFLTYKCFSGLPIGQQIYHLISEMKDIYSHVRICPYNNPDTDFCDLELETDVKRLMAHSRHSEELLHIWKEFHDRVGPPMKNKFMRYVQLANQAARMIGFSDAGEQMRFVYEDDDFEYEVAEAFQKMLPLYKELFTYVRKKLIDRYGIDVVRPEGPIPAHLLGNIWAQDWSNIYDIVVPYPTNKNADVTDEMLRKGFTPLRIFQVAEEFFTSLGLRPMPPEFWRHSMIDRPSGRQVQCTSSAWDLCNKVDFRIKQCTEVDLENLLTTHHEMAHIQYYLQYVDQPFLYRDGANPGFHEGVANAILLSVSNPVHLHKIFSLNNDTFNYETNINFLMNVALKKVAYAPFAYLLDQWRYIVFREGVDNMNYAWWELRLRFQGITPPVPRSEHFLDAAAKKHVPYDIPYIRYFVALLLEFQIHESLCLTSGHSGQLHTCDLYRSREAGRILEEALRVGKARHWKDIIRMLTKGKTDRLSAEPLLEYFQPLLLWLKVQNRDESVIGWNINIQDTALFQPLLNKSIKASCSYEISFVILLLAWIK